MSLTLLDTFIIETKHFSSMLSGYPKPRHPVLNRLPKEEIENRVRTYIVRNPLTFRPVSEISGSIRTGHVPLYDIGSTDKVLLVAANEFDHDVIDAYAKVLRESGAKVDVYLRDIGTFSSPEDAAA